MKVVGIGDAHLGRSYYPATTPQGVNQREADFEESFEAAVVLALTQEPDLVVWLGDVFDHPRPTYRSFRVAQRALTTIRQHGVSAVLISGNHDTPRLPGTGSPYSALADMFPEFHFAHRLTYERFELPGLVVHAVPQMLTVEATLEALATADAGRSLTASNLLLTHPRVTQVEPRYNDINEIEVDAGLLRSDFVLLGHYHFHTQVAERIWYAGSTDTFSFADDPDKDKGIVVLDTDTGACRHVPLPGRRPLVTLPTVSAIGLSPAEVQAEILGRVAEVPEGAVARIYIDSVDPEAYRLLDMEEIRRTGGAALHLKLEPSFINTTSLEQLPDLASVPAQWERYVERQDLTGLDRERILRLGHEYIVQAVEVS
ncbi:MAG TPA: metallophosphoesterase [Acidimicrobiales bacterium]|nr:metallophosphoesterase [Acidimicrobiales bacterium]